MNRFLLLCLGTLAFFQSSQGAWITTNFTSGFANSGYIPDDDLSGWADTRTLEGYTGLTVQDVSVTLDISGGFNGDLYGYLVHDSGFVVLLNRVGQTATPGETFGFSNSGFSGTVLTDTGSYNNIQTSGSYSSTTAIGSGPYNTGAGTLDTAFTGLNVDGAWTLFFSDQSSGDISQVTGWSLAIDAVPEPTTWAMIFFAAGFGGWRFFLWRKKAA